MDNNQWVEVLECLTEKAFRQYLIEKYGGMAYEHFLLQVRSQAFTIRVTAETLLEELNDQQETIESSSNAIAS